MSRQINLYNPALKTKRPWLTAGSMALIGGLCAAGLAGYGYVLGRDAAVVEKRAVESAAALKALRDEVLLEASAAKREPSKLLADEVTRLNTVLGERQQMAARLQGVGLGNSDGFSRYLTALARQHIEGIWLTGLKINGSSGDIFVQGRALSADLLPAYIQLLNREAALQGKVISELQLAEKNDEKLASAAPPRTRSGLAKAPAAARKYIEFSLGRRAAQNADG